MEHEAHVSAHTRDALRIYRVQKIYQIGGCDGSGPERACGDCRVLTLGPGERDMT